MSTDTLIHYGDGVFCYLRRNGVADTLILLEQARVTAQAAQARVSGDSLEAKYIRRTYEMQMKQIDNALILLRALDPAQLPTDT